ncbi:MULTISPECIES: hypothetical protein [Streptomyces]|uniref:C2H2-type domain-containing protein n=2 Tax=Streptomyces TaxID=1883 RepID=A0A646KNA2_STRJU|nr:MULTISPECIES: hypothetical protein [Streptomyces]MQS36371.1 hypothetical protein [Streptomyces katsurahamanus]MQT03705.1 hypothetical protein [Streptomyces jumonjinensis]
MSEITGAARVHEAYAFACMRCGHGWEQAYEIEHHIDTAGHEYVVYKANGARVPSPLSSPDCTNCGGHVVRIMRAGQVSSVLDLMARSADPERIARPVRETRPAPIAGPVGVGDDLVEVPREQPAQPVPAKAHHHWHLSDLLHPFHRR